MFPHWLLGCDWTHACQKGLLAFQNRERKRIQEKTEDGRGRDNEEERGRDGEIEIQYVEVVEGDEDKEVEKYGRVMKS